MVAVRQRARKWCVGFMENLRVVGGALRTNRGRSILTMVIVAIGITALMTMLTVIDAMRNSIDSILSLEMGAPITITSWSPNVRVNNKRLYDQNYYRNIHPAEAEQFCRLFAPYGEAGYEIYTRSVQASYRSTQTQPGIRLRGVNNSRLTTSGCTLEMGRLFTALEEQSSDYVAIIGHGIYQTLFDGKGDPTGKTIKIGARPYLVIGVLEHRGTSFGVNRDNVIYITVKNALKAFQLANPDCMIGVTPTDTEHMAETTIICERIMREVRRLKPKQANNFQISTSEEISGAIMGAMASLGVGSVLIGVITLFGSAVGLMNIMLASVTARTQEIGVKKAIGAKGSTVRQQFLLEASAITFIGGVFGVIFGTLLGSVAARLMNMEFHFPLLWALVGLGVSILVGVLAGYLPAKRAANLDPIESLRYE